MVHPKMYFSQVSFHMGYIIPVFVRSERGVGGIRPIIIDFSLKEFFFRGNSLGRVVVSSLKIF